MDTARTVHVQHVCWSVLALPLAAFRFIFFHFLFVFAPTNGTYSVGVLRSREHRTQNNGVVGAKKIHAVVRVLGYSGLGTAALVEL